jgi:flagellar biosynthesis/type III secretory pathway protein FliH
MEEINFLLEDKFSYNEDEDDPINIKRKKLAYKEEIASARNYLSSQKNKYYEDIKSGANASPEVKEALGFYNNYKQEQEELTVRQQKLAEHFKNKTNNLFNDNFKGFDFKVGENKYRFNVKDVQSTKEVQSDILKTFKTFLDKDNMLNDAKGYHKALFAARNADSIASHFYEQGKADAIKQISAEAKNINMDLRRAAQNNETTGFKVRALSGDDSSKLKVKIRKSI